MVPRTDTPPPTDRAMWARLLKALHPDHHGGDAAAFVWARELQALVSGQQGGGGRCEACPAAFHDRREASRQGQRQHQHHRAASDRILYDAALAYPDEFSLLTLRALSVGRHSEEPHRTVLGLLMGCPTHDRGRGAAKQERGASYRQLALIAHRAGMTDRQRYRLYEIARSVPLSELHASWILGRLPKPP